MRSPVVGWRASMDSRPALSTSRVGMTMYSVPRRYTMIRVPFAIARSSGTYLRYRAKLAKFDLIIFDEMGMRKFTATEAQDLCEIIEERSIDKSIAFTSQLPVDHWNEVIPDTVIFDAIRDRLEHSALTVNITGDTYRGVKARKLASKKKDA